MPDDEEFYGDIEEDTLTDNGQAILLKDLEGLVSKVKSRKLKDLIDLLIELDEIRDKASSGVYDN